MQRVPLVETCYIVAVIIKMMLIWTNCHKKNLTWGINMILTDYEQEMLEGKHGKVKNLHEDCL